jgi:hypothetical protein
MKLPHHDQAIVPRRKITDYLLAGAHPSGGDKAAFFHAFGFALDAWERLAAALKEHAFAIEVARIETSPFGTRYVVEGRLRTPSGRTPGVRTVWFTATEGDIPRLVTAYPLKEDAHD